MEKVNIAELLKDCPSGMELDCTIWDSEAKVFLEGVLDDDFSYPIEVTVKYNNIKYTKSFTKYGAFNDLPYCKCVIFPKGKTTWEGFQRPFKDGDIITCTNSLCSFVAIFKKQLSDKVFERYAVLILDKNHILKTNINTSDFIRPRFATEEEKQKLFQAIKDNGYKWIPKTKTLEKTNDLPFKIGDRITNGIVTGKIRSRDVDSYQLDNDVFVFYSALEEWKLDTSKFDITKLKPFKSEVLIRNDKTQKWIPAFWGYKADNGNYVTTFGTCRYCIPYEGNEHLLRTANDCDDYYKIWEA